MTRRPPVKRQRKYGAGHPRILDTTEKQLFAVLFFLKSYMTYDVLGFILDVDGSTACRNIRIYLMALEKTLKRKILLPVRKISTPEELLISEDGTIKPASAGNTLEINVNVVKPVRKNDFEAKADINYSCKNKN